MKKININERYEFQQYIKKELKSLHNYLIRSLEKFDINYAMDTELLFEFLKNTQPDKLDSLKKAYGDDYKKTIVNFINNEIVKENNSLINILKHGVEINHTHIDLMYPKPANSYNKKLNELYEKNIFSVMEEVTPHGSKRVDLVIFLNGLAIIAFELKTNPDTYEDAIEQFRTDRDPTSRLFLFKAGCLICFAMDTHEVHMTTKLDKEKTMFLPFNKGSGEGISCGAGNPSLDDDYDVSYMWKDILKPDTLIELISKFIFVEKKEVKDEKTDKTIIKENIIFPRYHQLDLIRKIIEDVTINYTSQNYLIQHSAGSGKTYSITWLAHRLASLHDENDNLIYDKILVITDRLVIDDQLQRAIMNIEHQYGFITPMDEKCSSRDLKKALESNTKIIISTIQKFQYICDEIKELNDKTFAVIIDEAHSSTEGDGMNAVNKSLSLDDSTGGKRPNISMFGFTATPKSTTLNIFGKLNKNGQHEAFHLYSMKQAIEEGFILDVLGSYTPYETYYKLEKKIADDPKYETREAKKQIARFINFHETNISQRIEIIVEHFKELVMNELGGSAKAMVITSGREEAVRYKLAFDEYIKRKNYQGINALVAFSGTVKLKEDDKEYTEPGMNGFNEKKLPEKFDGDEYQVLLVADKYQTGFDQKKLCAMYILKKLEGINAVQTLSRLNRIYPPYDKHVFILDFKDNYNSVVKAFEKYYETTILSNSVSPQGIYDLILKIDAYNIIDPEDVDKVYEILTKEKISQKDKNKVEFCMQKVRTLLNNFDIDKQYDFRNLVRSFLRFYKYLLLISTQKDYELHKKYEFLSILISYLNIRKSGKGFDLSDEIYAHSFYQKKQGEIKSKKIVSDPIVSLPNAETFNTPEEVYKELSEIIEEHNNKKAALNLPIDSTTEVIMGITQELLKSEHLKKSAINNTLEDFEFSYYSNIEKTSIEHFNEKGEIYTEFLNDESFLKECMSPLLKVVYDILREK